MPLFYDQRYLEMSYLIHAMSHISFAKCINFLTLLAVADIPDPRKVPIETSRRRCGHSDRLETHLTCGCKTIIRVCMMTCGDNIGWPESPPG